LTDGVPDTLTEGVLATLTDGVPEMLTAGVPSTLTGTAWPGELMTRTSCGGGAAGSGTAISNATSAAPATVAAIRPERTFWYMTSSCGKDGLETTVLLLATGDVITLSHT
jgi:hypothetical protein